MSKPQTVAEWMQAARAAGHDSLGIANDPEATCLLPNWWAWEDMNLTYVSPSLATDAFGWWYFMDHIGTAVHGPYKTAEEALSAVHSWRSL